MNFDPRDLEWQRRYEEKDTPWDKGAPAPALAAFLRERPLAGRVLVPGCGRGHDVRIVASQRGVTAVGIDVSPSAIEQARSISQDLPPAVGGTFILGDFFDLAQNLRGSFDWLVEHTCFCAIDPSRRADYVLAAATALRPGGKVFAIFYLDPDTDVGPPFRSSKEELSRLFDPTFTLLEEWIPRESFPGREGRELVRILQKRP